MIRRLEDGRGGRQRHLLALLLASGLVLGACGGGDGDEPIAAEDPDTTTATSEEATEEGEPVAGGSATMAVEAETNSYLPSEFAGTAAGYNVAWSIYDPLMQRNAEGVLEPYLAESLEPNDDLSEWTLTLRPGVMFHDGTALDAAALKDNFDNYLKAETANTVGDLAGYEMEVVDDLTVKYVLEQPSAALPDILRGPVGWPFSPTAAAAAGDDFGSQPVGTGPFKFVSWQRDSRFVAERNEDYWQEGLPYLDEVVFTPIPDEDSRAAAMAAGDIDATHSVRLSAFLANVRDIPGVEIYLGPGNSGSGAIFNTEAPPLDDARIRRSLSYALDQDALIGVIAGEAADVTEKRTQYYSESSPFYSEEVAEAWPTNDPEEAQRLYDEYVNDPARSDGKPVGSPVAFTYACTAVPSLQEQAQAYQAMWAAIGYEVTLQAVEQSVHIQNGLKGQFMANCWRQGSDIDPYVYLSNAFGDPEVEVSNFTNYRNDTVVEVLETLRTNADVDVRADAIERLGLLLAEDVPNTWTGGNNEFIGAVPELHGIDTWEMPDGGAGSGAANGITMWGHIWRE